MSALSGLAVVGLLALGMKGVAMIRDPGPVGRLAGIDELGPAEALPRPSWPARLVADVARLYGPAIAGTARASRRERITSLIDVAGRPGGLTLNGYVEQKVGSTLAGFAIGALLALLGQPLVLPALLILGWLWPDLRLYRTARVRQARIDRDLPDFLDILAVTVGAGSPFRPAVARVCESLSGPVAEEMTMALQQIDFGATAREALDGVRRRTSSEAMEEFVTSILQAEELGAPLAGTLVEQANDLRKAEHQRARQRAQKAAPRVSLVVTILMVPATIVVIAVAIFLSADVDFGGLFV